MGDLSIPLPDGDAFMLRGGHRLWAAPEVPSVTYEPDSEPVSAQTGENSITVSQPPGRTGIGKSVTLLLDGPSVTVDHQLTNHGKSPLDIAPWAITQLPPGGTAILPLPLDPVDQHGLLPNSELVLWPYTGVADTPFRTIDRLVLLEGTRTTPAKIGTSLSRGWLAYVRDGLVFVKRARHFAGGRYLDRGASAQCYCNSDFVELETLGEQEVLEPGESASHREVWELHRVDTGVTAQGIPQLLNLDGGNE